ncbi:MAG: hypothetical protein MZV70_35225 [Desulfobacterales bacterium]|nr:hypothetical protein [Desulfobacterales bacterium]
MAADSGYKGVNLLERHQRHVSRSNSTRPGASKLAITGFDASYNVA